MDFTKNLVLKENYTFLVADTDGMVSGGERGLYNRDTRFLSRYAWSFDRPPLVLLAHTPRPDRFEAHYAVMDGPSQVVGVRRRLGLGATRLSDTLELTNTSLQPQELVMTLEVAADFADMFEARGWYHGEHPVTMKTTEDAMLFDYRASDGLHQATHLRFAGAPRVVGDHGAVFRVQLEARATVSVDVTIKLIDPLETEAPRISYEEWRDRFDAILPIIARVPDPTDGLTAGPSEGMGSDAGAPSMPRAAAVAEDLPPSTAGPHGTPGANKRLAVDARRSDHGRVLERAVEDLRALLLFTPEGPVPAAGIPWFVTAFGRDALITATMLLPHESDVAAGTLRYLAARQGRSHDAYHAEAPGKILHEVRQGELARSGKIPFGRYYGTIDATPLFLVLLHDTYRATGDAELVRELQPNWEAALGWLTSSGDPDGDGFLEFAGAEPGKGLSVQSWKDSHDALSHADGTLASGAIAVSEVQGYMFAAYRAASDLYQVLGQEHDSERWQREAERLKQRFHEAFWLESMQTYALALDGDKRPLRVLSSDAGQLLWSGIVPEDVAPRLVETLSSPALFSGWGIRTLGVDEVRYNPVSYHNGSVWPHDTALCAGGLARYGFVQQAAALRNALFDLAASQADLRPPELVGGYPREASPPVTYPVACRPQAWAAAALVYLAGLDLPA